MRGGVLALLALAACADDKIATLDDVIPSLMAPSTIVADGASRATITVCTTMERRVADLKASLFVSDGTWRDQPTNPTLSVDLSVDSCADAAFVAPTRVTTIEVRATLLGYE